MDDITERSLAALIHRATDPRNPCPDARSTQAIFTIINKEPDAAFVASKLIASKIQSDQEWEAMQGLTVLEECMKHCGASFHSEVGKFRFLNEMIKLVSPKYLGAKTPPIVKKEVLLLMHSWTMDYPKETKIKEAYEMLKKQGVLTEEETAPSVNHEKPVNLKPNPLFQDEEKSKLLQRLLQSKNPDDLQAANRLIKTMVKEDERRSELKSKQLTELETVHNNVKLLDEMLDSYKPGITTTEEIELMAEVFQGCERLRSNVFRLAAETHSNEEMLNQVLEACDELSNVFHKYQTIIHLKKPYQGPIKQDRSTKNNFNNKNDVCGSASSSVTSLLDLSTPAEDNKPITNDILNGSLADLGLDLKVDQQSPGNSLQTQKNDIGGLDEIFGLVERKNIPSPIHVPLSSHTTSPVSTLQSMSQLTPVKVPHNVKEEKEEVCSKTKALKELDALGENLLKQCILDVVSSTRSEKVPDSLDLVTKVTSVDMKEQNDVDFLLDKSLLSDGKREVERDENEMLNCDDVMVDLTDDSMVNLDKEKDVKCEIKPLNDLCVNLDSITPSTITPLNVIQQTDGLTVTLHFTNDKPRDDVSVIVVTTISKHKHPVSNFLFQAVVPKSCKMRMQPPSGVNLPAHNPFLPPSALTQILLIANPNREIISLKVMISYTLDNETVTDMGEVDKLPIT